MNQKKRPIFQNIPENVDNKNASSAKLRFFKWCPFCGADLSEATDNPDSCPNCKKDIKKIMDLQRFNQPNKKNSGEKTPKIRNKYMIKKMGEEGMHQTINININGKYEDIDIAIAPAIAKLNTVGTETENSCQGGDTSSQAYITLKSGKFPDELVSAWKGAGFYVSKHIVRAAYKNTLNSDNPFSDIIEKYASILFQKSLNDWLKGDLDTTGKKYRLLRI